MSRKETRLDASVAEFDRRVVRFEEARAAFDQAVDEYERLLVREPLPLHRTEAGWPHCSTCDGGGCPDCTDPA